MNIVLMESKIPTHHYHWIRGHQDANKPRDSLSFPAQLNCIADDEAGQFQANHQYQPIVPPLPNIQVTLTIQGATITGHYKARIREAATLPAYFQYIRKKYDWSQHVINEINWGQFKQIIQSFRKQHTTIVKHIHEIAPTGHIAFRNNQHYEPNCPSCECQDETNDHVMRCLHESRSTWQTRVLQSIQTPHMEQCSDPILLDILRDGIQRWLRDEGQIPLASYPANYHTLILSQNTIGWGHLFRGRWSTNWESQQQVHAATRANPPDNLDGAEWTRIHGKNLIKKWLEVWEIRNTARHGKDKDDQRDKRLDHLRSRLQTLYDMKTQLLPAHQSIFHENVDEHIKIYDNLDGLENWINMFEPAILSYARNA
jgi:hypothetical protein